MFICHRYLRNGSEMTSRHLLVTLMLEFPCSWWLLPRQVGIITCLMRCRHVHSIHVVCWLRFLVYFFYVAFATAGSNYASYAKGVIELGGPYR